MDIDWSQVKRILIVKLRSIGDTVLLTPSITALRRFLPNAEIDVLLEDWVAPVVDGFPGISVITVGKTFGSRVSAAWQLRRRKYDIAFDQHGGNTASLLARASGARHRIGYDDYNYAFCFNHLVPRDTSFWGQKKLHSAERQLALLGAVGVPVDEAPRSSLAVSARASDEIDRRLAASGLPDAQSSIALIHPAAAFATKQWSAANFARTAEFLVSKGISIVAVATRHEQKVLDDLKRGSGVPIATFAGLSLPEITALASKARIFVGNDSGIAHIAAAVGTPSVVIFGSSSRETWYPWTDAPNEIVFSEFPCQPCPGYTCEVFGTPKCILSVTIDQVSAAVNRVLLASQH